MTGQIYQIYLANSVLVITGAILFYAALTDLKRYQIRNELIAVLAGRGAERRLIELAKVQGLGAAGDYSAKPATKIMRGGRE